MNMMSIQFKIYLRIYRFNLLNLSVSKKVKAFLLKCLQWKYGFKIILQKIPKIMSKNFEKLFKR